MKNILLITFFAFCSVSSFASAKAKDIKLSEFFGLPLEQRVEICATLVASSDIGECAAVKPAPMTMEDPVKMAAQTRTCFEGGESDSRKIAQCIRGKLTEMNMSPEFPNINHIEIAYRTCAKNYGDTYQLGVCTAALCTKLGN